jgi:hypothetical protein
VSIAFPGSLDPTMIESHLLETIKHHHCHFLKHESLAEKGRYSCVIGMRIALLLIIGGTRLPHSVCIKSNNQSVD